MKAPRGSIVPRSTRRQLRLIAGRGGRREQEVVAAGPAVAGLDAMSQAATGFAGPEMRNAAPALPSTDGKSK